MEFGMRMMKTSDFNFELPEELIARYPLQKRSESRLLHLKEGGGIDHLIFSDLPNLVNKQDILVFNNTRVMPARLFARKRTGGKIEILIERILTDTVAYAHIRANKSLYLPCSVQLEEGSEVIIQEHMDNLFRLEFKIKKDITTLLAEVGKVPLPSYMQRPMEPLDLERYQTIYATRSGAVAAPTAGLHFDEPLFQCLQEKGIQYGFITLHVGAGTFKPVTVEEIANHPMHREVYEIPQAVCDLVNKTKLSGGRIIAVGTTSVRALETAASPEGILAPSVGETDIFIYPGYRFRCIDALVTNFHVPRSTLLMLACALGGYENIMSSYQEAIKKRYRFYSYGDAMFISHFQDKVRKKSEI
jgi:S-adenosylmethionine:tRNA ribosyltransferase-isomerase